MPTQPPPADKRFKRGESGHPAGRPSSLVKAAQARDAMLRHLPEIVESVCQQAVAGDPAAARLVIERLIPALWPVDLPAPLPLPAGAGLAEHGQAILSAAGAGQIAPGQAAVLLGALAALGRIVETEDLAKRIEALENDRANHDNAEPAPADPGA